MQAQTVIPQLRITQADRSLAFYVDGLGFVVDWMHQFEPGFPRFMQLSRAGQLIFLSEHEGDCAPGGAVYFLVPDVNQCFAQFSARGVQVLRPPEDMPWKTREMLILDPDANRLRFASHELSPLC